jgi:predicted phage terminase large subunit-like protein
LLFRREGRKRPYVARNHAIQVAGPLRYPDADLPIDPYVLGAWLGDGDSRDAGFTSNDPEILDHIRAAGYRVCPKPQRYRYWIGARNGDVRERTPLGRFAAYRCLMSELRALSLLNNKHVPDAYLRGSIGQREALLAGLMDTDGTASKQGNCSFDNTNRRLVEQVKELVIGLGFKAGSIRTKLTSCNGRRCKDAYSIKFTPTRPVFRLSRKLARQRPTRPTQERRYIVDVRSRPSVPVRCIQVDSPSHLFLAGRACIPTHNTRTGAEWVRKLAETGRASRIALVAPTAADARDVVTEGESGLLRICPPWNRPLYEPSRRRLTWPSGAIATLYSAEEPDRLRGPQHDAGWCDELAAWRYPETWDQLMFGLRLGEHPRVVVTTTPRPTKLVRQLAASPSTFVTRGSTYENRAHLAPGFLQEIENRYGQTRIGRQEIFGEILDDCPGAIFHLPDIEKARVRQAPSLLRIVVAIDPAVSHEETSDLTGIVVAGIGSDLHAYVLDDLSGRYTPAQWARKAIDAYHAYRADRIVAEVNQGGALCEANLRTIDPRIPFTAVRASRGKHVRAEPIAALYEQGRVHHVGMLAALEDEMVSWDPVLSIKSPDRMDALVWAISSLVLEPQMVRRHIDNLPPG